MARKLYIVERRMKGQRHWDHKTKKEADMMANCTEWRQRRVVLYERVTVVTNPPTGIETGKDGAG